MKSKFYNILKFIFHSYSRYAVKNLDLLMWIHIFVSFNRGQSIEIIRYFDEFLCIDMSKWSHEIEFIQKSKLQFLFKCSDSPFTMQVSIWFLFTQIHIGNFHIQDDTEVNRINKYLFPLIVCQSFKNQFFIIHFFPFARHLHYIKSYLFYYHT